MLVLRARFAVFVGLIVLVSSFSHAVETAPTPKPVASLVEGALPSGVHYVILPHTATRGGVSLRLIVATGSVDEHDDERGFAHFVEHMAFNGTRHYPAGKLIQFFQRLGLAWGADVNADTSYTATTYKLDLPEGRADSLAQALELFRDYADGLGFQEQEVAREKGVVLSELSARDVSAQRTAKAVTRLLYASTIVADREVGGIPAQIDHATASQLRAFYRRCYRPERMTVLVVGDVDAGAVREKITAEFSSLAADGTSPAAIELPLPPVPTSWQAHVVVNPVASAADFSFVSLAVRPPDTTAGFRAELVERLAIAALNQRMRDRRDKEISRFGGGTAVRSLGVGGRFVHYTIDVQTATSRWPDAVGFAESELRRARTQGFNDAEVKEAAASLLTQLRNRVQSFASLPAPQLALEASRTIASLHAVRDPAAEAAFAEQQLPGISTDEVTGAIDTMFPENAFHLILRSPTEIADGPDLIVAACRKSAEQPLATATASGKELVFRYGDFGAPGKLSLQQRETDSALDLATFSNGVQLNLRPSTLEPQRFRIHATLGRGIADVPKNRPGMAALASGLLGVSDLGRHTTSELNRLMHLHGVSIGFGGSNGAANIDLTGPSAELPFALQVLTAVISDLKLDSAKLVAAMSRASAAARAQLTTPTGRAQAEALFQLGGKDPRLFVASSDLLNRIKFDEVSSWMRRSWLEGPLEVGIVGDFKPEEIQASAASTLGTLPPRRRRTAITADERLKFGSSTGKLIVRAKLPAGAAATYLAWPISSADEPKNNRALQLAADVLMDRLRLKLREELGATYSPHASIARNRQQHDYAYLWAGATFDPKSASALTDRLVGIASDLAQHGATAEEIVRLREPRRTLNAEQLHDNAWWLGNIVSCAQSRPAALAEARGHLTGYDELKLSDVNHAARTLADDAVTAVVVLPAPAAEPVEPAVK